MKGYCSYISALRRLLIVPITSVLLLGCSAAPISNKGDARAGDARTVTVTQAFENLLYIGLYVAKDRGFFRENGLDIRIQTGGGDAQAFAALASGKADFAQGDPAFVAISREKGWNGKVVGMVVNRAALWGVTLRDDIKPFSDPVHFRDLTVATFPAPNTSYVIQQQLDQKAGLKVGKDTKILQVVFGTEGAALRNKQCDIAQMLEPNVSIMERDGARVVFSYPDVWGPIAFTGVMTSDRILKEDPELVQRFISAYEKALRYVNENHDGTVDVACKRFPGIAREILAQALRRSVSAHVIPEHISVDSQAWRKLLKIRLDTGDLKSLPADNLVLDNSFARKAM